MRQNRRVGGALPLVVTVLAAAAVTVLACVAAAGEASSATAADQRSSPAPHRIGVRVVRGTGEFYDRATGKRFVPRGNNLVPLARQRFPGGSFGTYHALFNVGSYRASRARSALRTMARARYNVVRVWLNGACARRCLGNAATGRLSAPYVANVVHFLRLAKQHGIYVILTIDGLPGRTRYERLAEQQCCSLFLGHNALYLSPGGVAGTVSFWRDFVRALRAQRAPFDAILAYELRNEIYFDSKAAPLTLRRTIRTANGRTYNTANAGERQQMMDENLVHWINRARAAIRALDRTALVTVGFFHPQKPNPGRPGDVRLIRTGPAIKQSTADFVDVHPYVGVDMTLSEYMENYEIVGFRRKPIILGEFGAYKHVFDSARDAARALAGWVGRSCRLGFDGWVLFNWATQVRPYPVWTAIEGNSAVNRAIAPKYRPNPCGAQRR